MAEQPVHFVDTLINAPMSVTEALELVVELAGGNVLDEMQCDTQELEAERERQLQAIAVVDAVIQLRKDSEKR